MMVAVQYDEEKLRRWFKSDTVKKQWMGKQETTKIIINKYRLWKKNTCTIFIFTVLRSFWNMNHTYICSLSLLLSLPLPPHTHHLTRWYINQVYSKRFSASYRTKDLATLSSFLSCNNAKSKCQNYPPLAIWPKIQYKTIK